MCRRSGTASSVSVWRGLLFLDRFAALCGKWGLPSFGESGAKTGFTFQTENDLEVDGRGALFFLGCAPPKKLGAAARCPAFWRANPGKQREAQCGSFDHPVS